MVKTRLKCAGASDPGRIRHNNEDAFHIDADRGIFLVVDGIGGQAAGEKAAEIAVGRVRARLERQTGTAIERVREAITNANNEIYQAAQQNPEWRGMACVLTLAVLENGSAVVGHVGDSRLYQIRPGQILKVTHDHSPVGQREDSRELSEAEAMRHPRRNEVFRDVGSELHAPDDENFIEVQRIAFDPESALLLCSDGLSDLVPSAEIREAVESHAGNPQAGVRALIAAANDAGGKDNITAVLVEGDQFTPPPLPAVHHESRGGVFASRPAWFVYGVLIALGAGWFSRSLWQPVPAPFTPRLLTAGPGAPFSTIAAAMEEARAGDTVEALGGEYREQVRLKTGVALRSRVPREAILRAAPVSGGPAVIAENVQGARISGLRILADDQMPLPAGLKLVDSEVEADDMEVDHAGVGIEIHGGSTLLVGNAIHDCAAEGVLILGGTGHWLSHNAIQRNKGAGIAARDGAKPGLAGNIFEKNSLELPGLEMSLVRERNFLMDAGERGALPGRGAPASRGASPGRGAPAGHGPSVSRGSPGEGRP
jgi:serine/threonine protein phosphatase PrpC